MSERRRVKILSANVARKIAAGEVIDRPNAIVRELMDNSIDSGAKKISVEIQSGGIEKIRVVDNGCGMTKDDLETCARPHATSKIQEEDDLLKLETLGFRGEALASMAAVSRLEIISGGFKMRASVTEDHIIEAYAQTLGTIVQTQGLFENFPVRRQFLKRPASEATMCRTTFEEKVLPRPDIEFVFSSDGEEKLHLNAGQSLKERFVSTMGIFESQDLFSEIFHTENGLGFSFKLIIGEPSVNRSSRKDIFIYVNGRKVQEYALVQAIVYGTQGYFPNGTFPVACLFVDMDPSLVDFNIHPAKKEVRFKDINPLHHAISSKVKDFFRKYTISTMVQNASSTDKDQEQKTQTSFFSEPKFVAEDSIPGTQKLNFRQNYFSTPQFSYSHSQRSSVPSYGSRFARMASEPQSDEKTENYSKDSENLPETSVHNDFFHYVGCALGTFIIAEKDDTLYIIDQHAAHERMLYNKFMAECSQTQTLLVPYIVETESKADDNYLEAIQDMLCKSGFSCRNIGNGKWEFTTVPARWKGNEEDLKKDVLDRRVNPKDMINSAAASAACRTAVMDGTVLDDETASRIARGALELEDPHCPHGRPVFTTITRKQLFNLVMRT